MGRAQPGDAKAGHDVPGRELALDVEGTVALVSADDRLRQSEERFRGAFDNAPIGMALVAPDGRWLRVNQALCEILGYSEGDLLGKHRFQEVTHPDDLDQDLDHVRSLLAGEATEYTMEKRYVRADGRVVWALLSVSIVRDRSGEPLYFVSHVMDITERKLAEATLHERDTIMSAVTRCAEALLGADDWQDAIRTALGALGRGADVSRAYAFTAHDDEEGGRRVTLLDEWSAPGIEPRLDKPELKNRLSNETETAWAAELSAGQVVQAHARELGAEERALFDGEQIHSLVLVPVFAEGGYWGVLGFDECRRERQWSPAVEEALRTAAGLLGAAI